MKKPVILRPGDRVGIVAPGALYNHKKFRAGVRRLKSWGLVPVFGKNLFKKDFIFAGTINQRLDSFYAMSKRSDIKAIWCVRGGYGTYALAQELAKLKVPKNSKILIGLSDITALHLLLAQKWKWPVVHGPLLDRLGIPDQPAREQKVLKQTLFEREFRLKISSGLKSIGKKKNVSGILTGGNLATVVTSLKSLWEIKTDGKILFLEDIGERAYRIDRMLTQLKAAGKFARVKAVVFGDFTECVEKNGRPLWSQVLKRHFQHASYPVLTGIKSGHGDLRLALPLGVRVRVNARGRPEFSVIENFAREK